LPGKETALSKSKPEKEFQVRKKKRVFTQSGWMNGSEDASNIDVEKPKKNCRLSGR